VVIPDDRRSGQAFHEIPATSARCPWLHAALGTGPVARGAALEGGVLLVLARLKTILEITPKAATPRVQPGVAQPGDFRSGGALPAFITPPRPSSQFACSIGGNVS